MARRIVHQLVDDLDGFVDAVALLLTEQDIRHRLGAAAARRAASFGWDETARRFAAVLAEATGRTAPVEPAPPAHVHHRLPPADADEAATPSG